ncbi:UNVERIFIED_CONTAM: TkR86C [Trichonephila clavipes]
MFYNTSHRQRTKAFNPFHLFTAFDTGINRDFRKLTEKSETVFDIDFDIYFFCLCLGSFYLNKEYIKTCLVARNAIDITNGSISSTQTILRVVVGIALRRQVDPKVTSQLTPTVVHMLIAIVVLFGVCWLPYHIYFLYVYHHQEAIVSDYIQHVYLAIYWLAMSNSCYNPIVYYWMNSRIMSKAKTAECSTEEKVFHVNKISIRNLCVLEKLEKYQLVPHHITSFRKQLKEVNILFFCLKRFYTIVVEPSSTSTSLGKTLLLDQIRGTSMPFYAISIPEI